MMIDPSEAFNQFRNAGISFFTGVPDSLLKSFCAFVDDQLCSKDHVISANEGNAIAIATGHYLGTGNPSLVYMQNSGIGNAINPLLSLTSSEVYSIPMIVLVGWRGEPGLQDEPQHMLQGEIMPALLNAMKIPWFELSSPQHRPSQVIAQAIDRMHELCSPVVLLVRKNTFKNYQSKSLPHKIHSLSREQAIQLITKTLDKNDLIVSTTGMASRELFECRKSSEGNFCEDFLTVGSMGHASSIAAGIAMEKPDRKVICIDGDGAFLMHMGAAGIIGQSNLSNYIHIVLNNGAHDSVGGQPTVAFDLSLVTIANGCGYKTTSRVSSENELIGELTRLRNEKGPVFLEVIICRGSRPDLGRPTSSPYDNKISFMKKVRLRS